MDPNMDPSQQRQQLSHPNQQQQQPVNGQTAYATLPFASAPPAVSVSSPTQPPSAFAPHPYHQGQHLHSPRQQQQLQAFWANQMQEIDQTTDFKNHTLPLARIKKIMKADEDVKMISAEAPVIFAKACEMFILELTLRSWIHTEENKRRTLQKSDIAAAISRTDVFDFLVDIIPRDELKEEGLGITKGVAGVPFVGSPSDALPYYYAPPQASMGVNGMMMGKSVDEGGLYANQQQPRPPMPFMPWSQAHAQHPSQQPPSRDPSSDS